MQSARHFALARRIENILLHSSFHFSRVQWPFELKSYERDENSVNKNRISKPRNSLAVTTALSISSTIELYKQLPSAATSTGTKWRTSLAAFPTYSIAIASDRCLFSSNVWFGWNSSDSDTNPNCKTHRTLGPILHNWDSPGQFVAPTRRYPHNTLDFSSKFQDFAIDTRIYQLGSFHSRLWYSHCSNPQNRKHNRYSFGPKTTSQKTIYKKRNSSTSSNFPLKPFSKAFRKCIIKLSHSWPVNDQH